MSTSKVMCICAWMDGFLTCLHTHLVCSPLMFSLHLCQEATSNHLHPSVPLPTLRTSPSIWTLPGFIYRVWSPQFLRAIRAAAVVCGLWTGGGVSALGQEPLGGVKTEMQVRWDEELPIPGLWFRRWAPDGHLWGRGLFWEGRCCSRGWRCTTGCGSCLAFLWLIWFIRLIRFGGSLDEIQKSSFFLLLSVLRFCTL